MTNQPLSPEREKEIHLQLEDVADHLDILADGEYRPILQQVYRDLWGEIDRLRALPCRPPGTPEGMQVVRVKQRYQYPNGEMTGPWLAELAPLPQSEPQPITDTERLDFALRHLVIYDEYGFKKATDGGMDDTRRVYDTREAIDIAMKKGKE